MRGSVPLVQMILESLVSSFDVVEIVLLWVVVEGLNWEYNDGFCYSNHGLFWLLSTVLGFVYDQVDLAIAFKLASLSIMFDCYSDEMNSWQLCRTTFLHACYRSEFIPCVNRALL